MWSTKTKSFEARLTTYIVIQLQINSTIFVFLWNQSYNISTLLPKNMYIWITFWNKSFRISIHGALFDEKNKKNT